MRRMQGRVTRDDVRSAGLRRWDGRARVTTEWINIFHEPELCWPTGDCLVYLREPGQSSRGPAFRVHTAFLKVKGFDTLIDRCVVRNSIHTTSQCVLPNCPGCDPEETLQELYIPAPYGAGLEDVFNHHITTRNFFAWLYNRPLAGRTLGQALADLKERLDVYRPDNFAQNKLEVISFAESQRYLDFRECVDHALAALYLAERLQIEDLWIDSFAQCVGMSHRGLRSSLEYAVIGARSKTLVNRARLEMDLRLDRVNKSVVSFFENDVSGSFLGLPQPARDHLDRFRSFLKTFYVNQHGCWPPDDFEDELVQQSVYSTLFSDFQSLYQHLVDPQSSTSLAENDITKSGGVCAIQNIQAFDKKHRFEPLAQPLPLLPKPMESDGIQRLKAQRRLSWNPIQKRKAEKEARKTHDKEALIAASNRDFLLMECPLVRDYSEFEVKTIDDDLGGLSAIEGRKVRWILVYAVLQIFHSIAQPPKQVRNTAGLTYSLCCRIPKQMPWQHGSSTSLRAAESSPALAPDMSYSHTNVSTLSMGEPIQRGRSSKIRRRTLPAHLPGSLKASLSTKTERNARSSSLRRLMTRKALSTAEEMPPKRPAFCEIYIEGYGNGLNNFNSEVDSSSPVELTAEPKVVPQELEAETVHEMAADQTQPTEAPPDDSPTSPPGMSRESSTTSMSSVWSKSNPESDQDPTTPAGDKICSLKEILQLNSVPKRPASVGDETKMDIADLKIVDFDTMQMASVHINSETWDAVLGRRPATAPSRAAA